MAETIERDLFAGDTPSQTQREILADDHRYLVVAGNRGSRKTTACLWKVMSFCLLHPGVEGIMGRYIKKDLYVTTYSLWKKRFPQAQWGDVWIPEGGTSEEPDRIRFANGSVIHLIPLKDIDRFRGGNIGFFFIDQLEECPPKVLRDCIKLLRDPVWYTYEDEKGAVRTQDVGAGRRMGLATVNKNRGWYWIKRLFVSKIGFDKLPLRPHVAERLHIIEPPFDENRKLWEEGYYDDIIAAADSQAEIDFEVYGKDPSEWGLVFPDLDRSVHTAKFEFSGLTDASYMLVYDEGFDVPSCFLFLAFTPDEHMWVRCEHYQARMTITEHQMAVRRIAERIGFPLNPSRTRYVCDRAIFGPRDGFGRSIADQWGLSEWPWIGGPKQQRDGLSRIRYLMEPATPGGKPRFTIHEEDCPETLAEMEDAWYDEERPGKLAHRCKDHALDCLCYGALAALTPSEFRSPPNLDGTMKQFREARGRGRGWVASPGQLSSPRLFLPRERRR
jgi:hypothetical protein